MEQFTDMTLRYYNKSISKVNPKIVKYSNQLSKLAAEYHETKDKDTLKEIRALRVERNKIPSRIRTGLGIKYVRYADDWIIGIIGPKQIAYKFQKAIAEFLDKELKITLSPEKTKISHFQEDKIKFLGTYLSIPDPSEKKVVIRHRAEGKIPVKANHTRMNLTMPTQEILRKLAEAGFLKDYEPDKPLVPKAIPRWIFLDHRSIILRYNAIVNGYLNYYSFVENLSDFHTIINYALRHSCAKTIARKLRLNGRKGTFEKFGPKLTAPEVGKLRATDFKMLENYNKTRTFKAVDVWLNPLDVLKWRLETISDLQNLAGYVGLRRISKCTMLNTCEKGLKKIKKALPKSWLL
jgi:hypothetical protein